MREEVTRGHCTDVVRRTAEAFRAAPDDVASLLAAVGPTIGAQAMCVLRPRASRILVHGAWEAGGEWRHAMSVLDGRHQLCLEDVEPAEAVSVGACALQLPRADWACVRSSLDRVVVGVAGPPMPPEVLTLLATGIDVVASRDDAAADARLGLLLQERARIASVVHEGVAQELATVSVQLEVLAQLVADTPQVQELAHLTRTTIRRAIATVREAILDLTPIVPSATSLSTGMEELVQEFGNRWALDIRLDVEGRPSDVEPDAVGLAYAFVQEVLTNLRKHSAANKGAVRLAFDDEGLTVAVRATDIDGVTSPGNGETTGQGMSLMRGRARLLGGEVTSAVDQDGGREVVLQIPA